MEHVAKWSGAPSAAKIDPMSALAPPAPMVAPALATESVVVTDGAPAMDDVMAQMQRMQQRLDELEAKNERTAPNAAPDMQPPAAAPSSQPPAAEGAESHTDRALPTASAIGETADASDLNNIFSYSIEVAMDSDSPAVIFVCLLFLVLLLTIQVLYTFGYYDASTLKFGMAQMPLYMPEVHPSLFYSTSSIEGSNLTRINLMTSLCSLSLLALLLKQDHEGTLLTTAPLQQLMLGDGDHLLPDAERVAKEAEEVERSKGRSALERGARRVGRVLLLLFLQAILLTRALILPLYAAFGAAGNFAGATDAQEIVLNSVAIGFVFELDDQLYEWLLSKDRREEFESTTPRPMSALSSRHPRGTALVSNWCWVCFVVDAVVPTVFYLWAAVPRTYALTTVLLFGMQRNYVFIRLGLLLAANLHVTYRCGGNQLGNRRFACFAVAYTIMCFACAAVLITLAIGLINPTLGMSMEGVFLRPDTFGCVFGVPPPGVHCPSLHTIPGLRDELAALNQEVVPASHYMNMAWGAEPMVDEAALLERMTNVMTNLTVG